MNGRAQVHLSRRNLVHNFKIIQKKSGSRAIIPMIKADAYGHGMLFVAHALKSQKSIYGFGVATFDEAIALRREIKKIPIIVFSNSAPWNEEKLKLCIKENFEPVLSEIESTLHFQKMLKQKKLMHAVHAHLEINTGMNRLGIPAASLPLIEVYPKSVFTHLASAEDPRAKVTKEQMRAFSEVVSYVRSKFPSSELHFANSAAIWNAKAYPLFQEMDLVRPGLSLYGVKPFEEAKVDGLKPVMTITAPVINRIYLEKGDTVGYGATYQCKKSAGEWLAVLGSGYADGIFRTASNQGFASFKGKPLPFRGRVSMDLLAIEGHATLKVGDSVELWGGKVDPYRQAALSGTNPYEWMTRVGARVRRLYE